MKRMQMAENNKKNMVTVLLIINKRLPINITVARYRN